MEQTYGSICICLSSGCIVLFVAVSFPEAPISDLLVYLHDQASNEWRMFLKSPGNVSAADTIFRQVFWKC
jgi:hypothetical protein